MSTPLMACGHAANATTGDGSPCCAICAGLTPDAMRVADDPPSLEGRQSQCTYCRRLEPSKLSLPFFELRPDHEYDSHYDGCRGWD